MVFVLGQDFSTGVLEYNLPFQFELWYCGGSYWTESGFDSRTLKYFIKHYMSSIAIFKFAVSCISRTRDIKKGSTPTNPRNVYRNQRHTQPLWHHAPRLLATYQPYLCTSNPTYVPEHHLLHQQCLYPAPCTPGQWHA